MPRANRNQLLACYRVPMSIEVNNALGYAPEPTHCAVVGLAHRMIKLNHREGYVTLGFIPRSWIMMRHVSCILLLEWSTTSKRMKLYRISVPFSEKDPRFLFEKRRGQHREFWPLVSIIDGSTLPQDCVEK